jgi:hypothetical protein
MWPFIFSVFALIFLLSARTDRDNSDPIKGRRSGLIVYTDELTGLQYLKGGFLGGITPRLDKNGRHVGIYNDRTDV